MSRLRAATGAALATLAVSASASLFACAASDRSLRASGNGEPVAERPAPVAVVGETRISKADLSDALYARFREPWLETLDALVDERIVAAETKRLGVVVPPEALSAAVETEAAARAGQVRARFGEGKALEDVVRETYGTDVASWKRDVLAPRLLAALRLERVVRLAARTREQISCRVIVTRDRATGDDLRAKIEAGADFTLLALQQSEDPSKSDGGLLPAFSRGDLRDPAVEQALFAAPPGALVGPLEVRAGSGTEFHLYRVAEHVAPWSGDGAALLVRLEVDLEASPVGRPEYERWAAKTRREANVKCFAPDGSVLRPPGKDR